jgi:hypothetical protein
MFFNIISISFEETGRGAHHAQDQMPVHATKGDGDEIEGEKLA